MSEIKTNSGKTITPMQRESLFRILQDRFERNMGRHPGMAWTNVRARLEANEAKLWSLHEMERTGGEPDVVGLDDQTGELILFD